jgi:LL-diaminopimelate aminotransferase
MKINENYLNLKESYLFSTVAKKVREYKAANPNKKVISLGIGDVTLPLCAPVVDAMTNAVKEMGDVKAFRGYGDEQGYEFLRLAVCKYYRKKRVDLQNDEIFISDGAKSDLGNILDIFSADNTVLVPNPVYPVYVDTNIMAGRKIVHEGKADIIYLCSPSNPTGEVLDFAALKKWVDFALENNAVILFDAAYEAFVRDQNSPTSIYQIEGAKECAVEICSLSKTAGFTGVRCGYTVVPHDLVFNGVKLNKLWLRRQTTKFNGVPYIVQRGAEAVFKNLPAVKKQIDYYMKNAEIITDTLRELNIPHVGGENAPYIWVNAGQKWNMSSWEFFDYLLNNFQIVGTPGVGFGTAGEGYFRFTAFGKRKDVVEAMRRLKSAVLPS